MHVGAPSSRGTVDEVSSSFACALVITADGR
jgi:hypothetical protein